jgi:maltooligosyltrehalose trehalohydrolase
MGEEYGETAPFQYFTSHSDADLIEAVRKGRAEEFDDFIWEGEPPDPHDEQTFLRSKLNWELARRDEHASLRRLYRHLLALRRDVPSLRELDLDKVETHADDERRVLLVKRAGALLAFNFNDKVQVVKTPFAAGRWESLLDTGAALEGDQVTLPPNSFAVWATAGS